MLEAKLETYFVVGKMNAPRTLGILNARSSQRREATVASSSVERFSDYVSTDHFTRYEQTLETPRYEQCVARTMIGISPQWRAVLNQAKQAGPTETTTSVLGESGPGKEVVAKYVHSISPRRRGPFIAINRAALPEHVLESELFGFERGAFTGAFQLKPGHLELADGGVLFLDEINELALSAQATLLRALQEREIMRLGGRRPIKVNVRVIVATSRDLRAAVSQGLFREDLFYRINVFEIQLPPLRGRGQDILLFADRFLDEVARTNHRPAQELDSDARSALPSTTGRATYVSFAT